MPVFEFEAPDGKVYEIEAPEGATQEQAFQVLQSQLSGMAAPPAGSTPAAPAGAVAGAPPGPPAGTPVPGAAGAPPVAAPAVPGPMARDPGRFQQAIDQERQARSQAEIDSMGGYERFITGMGQSVASNARGARQIWNYLTNDQQDLNQIAQEEAAARVRDQPLLDTGLGRTGQITGHVLQAALPGGVAGKGATALGGGVARYAAAEGLAGAGMAALQPVIGDESRATNMAVGGAIGAALPVAGGIYKFGKDLSMAAARGLAPRGTARFIDDAAAMMKSSRIRERAGKEISRIVEGQTVALKPMQQQLAQIRKQYGDDLPKAVNRQLDTLVSLAQVKGAKLRGEVLQEIRSAVGKEAAASKGLVQTGLQKFQRTLDQGMDAVLPKAKAVRLREAREAYRTGVKPSSSTSGTRATTRGVIEAMRAPYGAPEQGE